jgi:UDP-N-acetyl-D-mannosaminuronate dehydrogenase
MTFKEDLLEGKKRVGIWGLGYIGYSSMANFASRGVSCIGTDVLRDVSTTSIAQE